MRGMLLGFFDPLMDILKTVFGFMIEWILTPLLNMVVVPLVNFLFTIITYVLGLYFYQISVFILALIDFVEMLFRALAGLASDGTGASIGLSIAGSMDDSGDILLQLIRHRDIQQAFLAMCIVGLFLLVVTSVFQIIKVEYTTEGAKNAKGPILNKAFKGLANLMLLPILCVFGIIFSNQLLGLLDKATRAEGENPTISGTLFVTAASEAHYLEDETQIKVTIATPHLAIVEIIGNTFEILTRAFDNSWGSDGGEKNYIGDRAYREMIDNQFINQAENCKYYDIENVTQYYDYGDINYLLLILGGCVVLKCLFFTCFGMVIRLYKCAVLFIISPVVIGMTPINAGGLGQWRTSFIGQVLSAYGTILSINLFFIIVRVLLGVEVSFNNFGEDFMWGESFMTGLLKSIFVMAGCLLIEQFAKEIGGYFGAEDAMSAGKDMAKKIGDTAMSGVKVAAGVGSFAMTGGAALLSGAAGIAGKIGGGFKDGFKKAGMNEDGTINENARFRDKVKGGFGNLGKMAKESAVGDAIGSIGGKRKIRQKNAIISDNEKSIQENETAIAKNKKRVNEINMQLQNDKNLSDEKKKKLMDEKSFLAIDSSDRKRENKYMLEDNKAYADENKKTQEVIDRKNKRKQDFVENIADTGARNFKYMGAMMHGLGNQAMDFIPGHKEWSTMDKAAHEGAKAMGDGYQASMAKVDKVREKRVEDSYEKSIFGAVDRINLGVGAKVVTERVQEEVGYAQKNTVLEANDAFENLLDYLKRLDKSGKNDWREGMKTAEGLRQTESYMQSLNGKGANLSFSDMEGLVQKFEMSGKIEMSDLKLDFDKGAIGKAIEAALKKGHGVMNPDTLREELMKVMQDLGDKGNKNMIIQLENIIKKVMQDLKD